MQAQARLQMELCLKGIFKGSQNKVSNVMQTFYFKILIISLLLYFAVRGEEMDKTYYEANRSNRSLQEISTWLHLRDSFCREMISGSMDKSVTKSPLDSSGMQSFRELLHKVKDILEDTYSDNAELSTVTRQLEDALDEIIGKEERVFLQKKERTLERVKRT